MDLSLEITCENPSDSKVKNVVVRAPIPHQLYSLGKEGRLPPGRQGKPSKQRQNTSCLLKSKGQVYMYIRVFEGRRSGAEPFTPTSTQGLGRTVATLGS